MGSFGSDVTYRINLDPASVLAAVKKIDEQMKLGAQGVAGAYEKAAKQGETLAKQMIDVSSRAGKQLENQLRSIEKQTQSLGKTTVEMNEIQRKWMLDRAKGLKQQEDQEKRINAIYDQRRKFFEEEERRQNKGPAVGGLLFRGARDIFEGRMSYGVMDIGRAAYGAMGGGGGAGAAGAAGAGAAGATIAGISATTAVVGGLAVGLVGLGVAGYKAAESMGEFGHQIREIQTVTGMTATEVQKLQIASALSGHSMDDIVHGMRGLTQILAGGGTAAVKAGADLQKMGVDMLGVSLGEVSLYTAMQQLSDAVKKNGDAFETNATFIEVFKKSGLNLKETVKEMTDAEKEASKIHIFDDNEMARMDQFYKTLKDINIEVGNFIDQMKLSMATQFNWTFNSKPGSPFFSFRPLEQPPETLPHPMGPPIEGFLKEQRETRGAEFDKFIEGQGTAGIEGAKRKLSELERQYDALIEKSDPNKKAYIQDKDAYIQSVEKATAALRKQKDVVEALTKAESDRKAIEEAVRQSGLLKEQRAEDEFALPAQKELNRVMRLHGLDPRSKAAQTLQANYADQIQFEKDQQARQFQREMLEVQQTVARETGRARLGGVEPVNVRDLGQFGVTRADVERDITEQYQQRMQIAMKTFTDERAEIKARDIAATDSKALEKQRQDIVIATGKLATAEIEAENAKKKEGIDLDKRAREEELRHVETMSKIRLADQEDTIKHNADLARRQAELRFKGDSPAESIAEEYRIAVTEAQDLYDAEMRRIAAHETGYKIEEASTLALNKLHREDEQASEDAQFRLAKMQQEQLDKIKSKVEPLYQTLFNDPKKFPQQLRSTIQEAALHPIISGISEMTANALHPLIYGAGGTGGISGMFGHMFGGGGGGKLDSLRLKSDGTVPVSGHVTIDGVSGGPGGGPGGGGGGFDLFNLPQIARGGNFGTWMAGMATGGPGGFGIGGGPTMQQLMNLPSRGTSGLARMLLGSAIGGTGVSAPGTGFDFGANFSTTVTAPYDVSSGGGPSLEQLQNLPQVDRGTSFGESIAQAAMKSVLGGGQSKAAGTSGYVEKLAGLFGKIGGSYAGSGGLSRVGTNIGQYGGAVTSTAATGAARFQALSTGPFAGTPAGPAAGAVGMMLASAGIFGQQRGQLGGVAEAAGGGFLVAGPVGAAVGAGIGLGEMAAGVESPRAEAKRLVTQLYHISINNTTADQIVSMANQTYGGRVSIAVRSPEVRQMLGLYAAGTGQGLAYNQTTNAPHGASLVESGGILQQQATYQYGRPYVQSSSLPVYGGVGAQTLGVPGGAGLNLSLNIGGQDATKFLQGNVVSPEVISQQYASAMYSSSGRVPAALLMSEPGGIAS